MRRSNSSSPGRFFFSSRRRHTRFDCDWSSDVCSSDLAEVSYRRLAGNARPLSFYLDFALTNYREPQTLKNLSEGITEYRAAKQRQLDQDQLSVLQNERIGSELKRLDRAFPKKLVADMTVPTLVEFLEVGKPGMKTFNNRRGILSTFFKYAFHRGWIAENPILKVPHHRIRKRK